MAISSLSPLKLTKFEEFLGIDDPRNADVQQASLSMVFPWLHCQGLWINPAKKLDSCPKKHCPKSSAGQDPQAWSNDRVVGGSWLGLDLGATECILFGHIRDIFGCGIFILYIFVYNLHWYCLTISLPPLAGTKFQHFGQDFTRHKLSSPSLFSAAKPRPAKPTLQDLSKASKGLSEAQEF